MGVSAAQFTSAGQTTQHYIPGVYSRRHTVASGSGVSSGNLAIIGESMGGEPLTLLQISDVADAKEQLTSGALLEAVCHAFNGSNTYVPQYVYAMRINSGTQATRTLYSGEEAILTITSADWGVHQNQIKMLYEDGTTGKKVTVSYKGEEESVDNIERESFSILYAGESENDVTCTINADGLTITSDVDGESLSISFDECETVSELVTRINDTGIYVATLIDTSDDAKTADLDYDSVVISGDEAVVFYSDLAALIEALESISYIGSVEYVGSTRVLPDDDEGYVYFTGGTHGTTLVSDYSAALEALQTEDIQIISTPSTDADVHSLISDHCTSMSTVAKKRERTFIVGMPSGTSIDDGVAEAKSLNNELGSVVITGANANNPLTGSAEDISPAYLACKCAGVESAMATSLPLTNKVLKVNSFSTKYKDSEMETLIKGGVMPFGENEAGELVCIRGITTYQAASLIQNERSMERSVLYMDRDLRSAFSARTGTNTAPSESEILQTLYIKAAEWLQNDLITQADDGSNVWGAKVTFDGDKTYLVFSRYIRAPNNFTFITGTNMVYTSTVEV